MAYYSNSDKILQAVLKDSKLIEQAEYDPAEFETIADALTSENAIVCAVAKIIDKIEEGASEREIFNEVSNYLKNNI